MYNRLKSSLLNHFHKNENGGGIGMSEGASGTGLKTLSKEEKKRLRHSLAECQLLETPSSAAARVSAHSIRHPPINRRSHAPLAPSEEYLDESSSTVYSDLFSSTFSTSSLSASAAFYCDYEDPQDPIIMPSPGLSWNVQYIGSFPISSAHIDNLGARIDNYQPQQPVQNAEMTITVLGVRISCEKINLMSHSLRRITDISSRPHSNNFGYVATEPVGRTYRRMCHVFHCQNQKDVIDIETILRNTHHSATSTTTTTTTTSAAAAAAPPKMPMTPKQVTASTSAMPSSASASTMTEKRSASTVFLNRILGKKGSQTVDESGQCKRKRRPVSAVFSSAIHRLSSSTSAVNPKRMSTIEPSSLHHIHHHQTPIRTASPVPEEPRPSEIAGGSTGSTGSTTTSTSSVASSSSGSTSSSTTSPVPPPQAALVFDNKLQEWIYPIDAALTQQLDKCGYFVGMPTKDSLVFNLLSQPEGAFVIRHSESKTKCLALSMRVPNTHNPGGISHYLIIRNEQGFRLKLSGTKKPFPTLQMLLTHHSVLEGFLPCTLHFVQWQKANFKQLPPAVPTIERNLRSFSRHSTALTKIDENRNITATSTPTNGSLYRPSGSRCGLLPTEADDFTTPKNRRSRHEINALRRSHFFDDRQIVL